MLCGSRWQWIFLVSVIVTSQVRAEQPAVERLNAESVYALLDLVQTIVTENAGYRETRSVLQELGESDLDQRLTELAARNASNPGIVEGIDRFLATEARTIYFRRFRNVTPEHFRRALLALPFVRIDSPGDIATPFYELTENLNEVRSKLDDLVTRTDLGRCRKAAKKWLPEGNHPADAGCRGEGLQRRVRLLLLPQELRAMSLAPDLSVQLLFVVSGGRHRRQ